MKLKKYHSIQINLQEKKLENLKKHKQGLMQQLFPDLRGGVAPSLRFMGFTEDWRVVKLGEVSNIIMGQSPSSKSYNSDKKGMFLIQGNADILNRESSPRYYTSEPTKICDVGDIIMTVRAPVGAVAKSVHNACIGRGVCAIKNRLMVNPEFLYQILLDFENKWQVSIAYLALMNLSPQIMIKSSL